MNQRLVLEELARRKALKDLAGDTITAIDGVAIEDSTALIVTVRSKAPGDAVSLSVLRGGQTIEVTLTLGSSTT